MSFIQVNHVLDWMYRGSHYTLKAKLYKECSSEALVLTDCNVYLTLTTSNVEEDSEAKVLEKQGTITEALDGEVEFEFVPADTEDLLARSYHMSIFVVDNESKVIPVVSGTFGIVGSPLELDPVGGE